MCKARCNRYAQLCGVTLMTGVRKPNVFLVCREEKPRFEMSKENE